ncbi:MAG: hypothetical protein Q4F41_01590 [Eubacteriales bacterium]|nr:hypothetical protein [Eubacteriales bacterium]
MKRQMKKLMALTCAAALAVPFSAYASEAAEECTFTWLLDDGVESIYYDSYDENPVAKYWQSMEWDADGDGAGEKIAITYQVPPAGAQGDNFNTLLGTGELPEIVSMSYSSQNAQSLYEDGVILDLTEYVEKYMPNYLAWMEEHPEKAASMTNDGKYLMLYNVADVPEDPWGGYMYRRDWLVQYGTNPETGEAFTGGWNEDKTEWTDNVVFPSGGSDPVYISDWEWMLGILNEAIEREGIEGGYAFQLYYTGFLSTGDFNSGFGTPMCNYLDEDGVVKNGLTSEGARAYLQCMNTWYENGWINQDFEENVSDTFFMVDMAGTYSGKVGCWYGLTGQIGNGMAGEGMEDICVYGAAQPINDVYGDDSCKGKEPNCFFETDIVSTGICITEKAAEKDLATLCTALDYFYGSEGALLRTYGFSDEQQAEIQDAYYNENGFENGVYTAVEEDGKTVYQIDPNRDALNMAIPLNGFRMIGMAANDNIDWGRDQVMQHSIDEQKKYTATAAVGSTVINQMTSDQSAEVSTISANLMTYTAQAIPSFIIGRTEIDDDAQWQSYCDEIAAYGIDTWVGYLNEALGR